MRHCREGIKQKITPDGAEGGGQGRGWGWAPPPVAARLLLASAMLFSAGCVQLQSMSRVDATDAGTTQPTQAIEVVRLTNVERSNARMREFRANARLARSAQLHAEQMASAGRLAHELPGSRYPRAPDRLAAAGYVWSAYAENIATGRAMTPATAVSGWMRSAGHRANILNARYTEIGAGYAVNERGERYYVQVFGDPAR